MVEQYSLRTSNDSGEGTRWYKETRGITNIKHWENSIHVYIFWPVSPLYIESTQLQLISATQLLQLISLGLIIVEFRRNPSAISKYYILVYIVCSKAKTKLKPDKTKLIFSISFFHGHLCRRAFCKFKCILKGINVEIVENKWRIWFASPKIWRLDMLHQIRKSDFILVLTTKSNYQADRLVLTNCKKINLYPPI
jgi:hypothetical protein